MTRRKGTYTIPLPKGALHSGSGASLYVGFDGDIPIPPRTLCRSCDHIPHPVPEHDPYWCCTKGFRPIEDGSCKFYDRAPGADDE